MVAYWRYPEWIELCKPKKVEIFGEVHEDGYDSLRKVVSFSSNNNLKNRSFKKYFQDSIKLYSCNLESICDNVASHVPRLLANIRENISLQPDFYG